MVLIVVALVVVGFIFILTISKWHDLKSRRKGFKVLKQQTV